jgi:2-polyprenyl-3-methyl-5-hydroxy-6-metoxy-1,4-benzoquinol methylase
MERQYPLPTLAELTTYYNQAYTDGLYRTFITAAEMKKRTAQRRLAELGGHVPKGRWLDVGASTGLFVAQAIKEGIDAEGIELARSAVEEAQQAGLPVRQGDLNHLDAVDRYAVVTAFDVIEHSPDPLDFLRRIGDCLRFGGYVVLTTPDLNCLFRRLMGRRWFFYIPDEHLFLFTRSVMTRLLARAGFEVERIGRTHKPLTFDYVMTQIAEYNPLAHRMMAVIARLLPRRVRSVILPLYIGEMMVIARLSRGANT